MSESAEEQRKLRILIADDDHDLVRGLRFRLASRGFHVTTVFDGDSAVAAALSDPPDGIVLDIRMPGSNGFEVLERLGASTVTAGIPVLVLSANIAERARSRALSLGAAGFMTKPFNAVALLAALEAVLLRKLPVASGVSPSVRC